MDAHPDAETATTQPQGSDSQAFRALGSEPRLDLLRELAAGDGTVLELSRATGLRPSAVRYHLGVLLQDGLIERVSDHRDGHVGRPTNRYRLRARSVVNGFPPRHYDTLAEVLLNVLCGTLSQKERHKALYEAGRKGGRSFVATIQRGTGVGEWTPEDFVRHCVEGQMTRMGMRCQVVDARGNRVRYRAYTCPFQELAARYPEPVCDSLDAGFHDGIAEGLGPHVENRRFACLGHGDPYCEYSVMWTRARSREERR